ncbi:hypothetical protein [Haloarcula litorea]|uniref:hypothetical protein n=1 Tax=Haloarcula litorea TaxID=3032579 RepID=UPI0023E83687|nr:hypothetical protein [Halomicroarcula sp. GDY20]
MVEDRITDGKRIGQLLASELTGLERGPLGSVSVTEADPDVTPTADGAFAYAVTDGDERIGEVSVTPGTARLTLRRQGDVSVDDEDATTDREDVTVESGADRAVLVAHSGAAVKALVDAIAARR